MPVADAGIGLPGTFHDARGAAAFVVHDEGVFVVFGEVFGVDDGFELAAAFDVAVVKVCGDVEARLLKGQAGVVEIEQVGVIFVEQFGAAGVPAGDELGVVGGHVLVPGAVVALVPLADLLGGGQAVGHDVNGAVVEGLGVEALPPLALAILFAEAEGVVAHTRLGAGGIVAVSGLKPVPGVGGVVGDAEAESGFAGGIAPALDEVLLGTDAHGVPLVVGGIVVVKVVVVIGQGDEVFGAGFLVAGDECLGVPFFSFPEVVDLHEAEFGWVTVFLDMGGVLAVALDVHVAGIPVAGLGLALGRPVGPNAELGVAEPVWDFVTFLEGFPRRFEGSIGDNAGSGGEDGFRRQIRGGGGRS